MNKKHLTQYYVAYERDENGGYIASAPAISGCVVRGATLKEAHDNIQDAIRECLEVIQEFHKKLPKESMNPEVIQRLSFVKVPEYA